ncbi:hypothetical protein Dvina_19260 [Dactylosporangium vinaceum]|uniref:Uncharacterized protein n=1 Tax=Dactylosporangium vinaceum TaxID=53362 RepID=A0ABV5M9X4_9ACTN|nr:hypothetical protein [Dactylosporangium vinaceum]UAC00003.1 hypothetical protein Dvina_19260 [Dactylosporangium vinaceum]
MPPELRMLRVAIVDDLVELREGLAATLTPNLGIDVRFRVDFQEAVNLPFRDLDAIVLDAHDRRSYSPDQYSGIAITRLARTVRGESSIAEFLKESTGRAISLEEQKASIADMLVVAMMSQWYDQDELRARFAAAGGDIFWPLNRWVDLAHADTFFEDLAHLLHEPVDWSVREVRGRRDWLPDTRGYPVDPAKAEQLLASHEDIVDLSLKYVDGTKSQQAAVRDRLNRRIRAGRQVRAIRGKGATAKAIARAIARIYGVHSQRPIIPPGVSRNADG